VARSSTAIFQGVICCFLFYGAEDYSTAAKGRLKSCNGIEAAFSDGLCGYFAAGGYSRDANHKAGNQHQLDTQLHQRGTADKIDKPSAGQNQQYNNQPRPPFVEVDGFGEAGVNMEYDNSDDGCDDQYRVDEVHHLISV